MAVRRRFTSVPARQRTSTNWARAVPAALTVVAAGTKVLVGTLVLSNPGINEVVRRTRGVFSTQSDQTSVLESPYGSVGFIVVNDLALAAGVASIPGPVTDANDDGWFVWEAFLPLSGSVDQGSVVPGVWPNTHYDSKAMRKIPEGFGVAIVVENASSVGLEFAIAFSILTSRA